MAKQYFTLVEPDDRDAIFQKILSGQRIVTGGRKKKDIFLIIQMLDSMGIEKKDVYGLFKPALKDPEIEKIESVGKKQDFPAAGSVFGVNFTVFDREEDSEKAAKMLQFCNDRYGKR